MKRILPLLLVFALFASCTAKNEPTPKSPERVVSMMASFAEVWQLAGGTLCGVTEDVVERGLTLPADVKTIGTVKSPNIEEIIALQPDLVLASADLEPHQKAVSVLEGANIPCKSLHIESFSDYLSTLRQFCDLTGREDLYQKNGAAVDAQIKACIAKVPKRKAPTVLLLRAMSSTAKALPADHMTSLMLSDLGAENIAARTPSLLEELSMEEILRVDPDFILVVPMGNLEAAEKTMAEGLAKNPAWSTLSAVKGGCYLLLDRELFHYKPNARWGEAYETLFDILYPEA